jgi:hypothetical protein
MSYIDDWYGTPITDKKSLQELCGNTFCGHMRYLHGDTTVVKDGLWKTITHTPGKCSNCKCKEYTDSPISKDAVLDAHDALGNDEKLIHLADIGIGPLMCSQIITRWSGVTATEHPCLMESNHEGEHVS